MLTVCSCPVFRVSRFYMRKEQHSHARSDDAELCLDTNVIAIPYTPELSPDSRCPCNSSPDFFTTVAVTC